MSLINTYFKQIILVFTLLLSATSARKVKFSVVGFGKTVKVKIGSSSYSLTKYDDDTPLYQATINVNDGEVS